MRYIGETTQTPSNIDLAYARAQGADVLYGGNLVAIEELEDSFENRQVYKAEKPAAETKLYGIVLNGGYETLADGRRPEGQPNFTEYGFTSEMPCVVLRPSKFQTLRIGLNAIANGTAEKGKYLVPDEGKYTWKVADSMPETGLALKIEKITEVGQGGRFGFEIEKVAEVIVVAD